MWHLKDHHFVMISLWHFLRQSYVFKYILVNLWLSLIPSIKIFYFKANILVACFNFLVSFLKIWDVIHLLNMISFYLLRTHKQGIGRYKVMNCVWEWLFHFFFNFNLRKLQWYLGLYRILSNMWLLLLFYSFQWLLNFGIVIVAIILTNCYVIGNWFLILWKCICLKFEYLVILLRTFWLI